MTSVRSKPAKEPYPEVWSGYVSGTAFDSDSEMGVCTGARGHFMEYADDLSDARSEEEDTTAFSSEATTGPAAALNLDEAAFVACVDSQAKKTEVPQNMRMEWTKGGLRTTGEGSQ